MISVSFEESGTSFDFEDREPILDWPYLGLVNEGRTYDVAADGRFLALKNIAVDARASSRPEFVIVDNWFEELERLVPAE